MVDNNCIIEGNVKFRDGKKWKSRWCVMRKLSPVADCLHLQLYGDSKDRYKQGQTKASLSLQDFLGVESGFTLDKESNTIAIICQDVIVVLAFDTRERLMQWQVKISNNLGEDREFLVLISSAPPRAKLPSGPAQLHVQEQRFCMTLGVPPRLLGIWEIGQLRRYGVVEGRFCFEGGSRCGRGEGLHVLISEQAEEIGRALAAGSKSPLATGAQGPPGPAAPAPAPLPTVRFELQFPKAQPPRAERCASCTGKLGQMSKSSTGASSSSGGSQRFDRLSLSSYSSNSSEYSCGKPMGNYDVPKPIAEPGLNYDTPRKMKECLAAYPNYDTPQPHCPCHNLMSWAGFVLPYCSSRRPARPDRPLRPLRPLRPVRLSGEGKMPVLDASGQLGVYGAPEARSPTPSPTPGKPGSNYENLQPVIDTQPNYANLEPLCHKCQKCGHSKDEAEAAYLAMQPVSKELLLSRLAGPKSSSNPALSASSGSSSSSSSSSSASGSERKRAESEYRVPGSAMLSSPYFRRRLLDAQQHQHQHQHQQQHQQMLRKRSYSSESGHYLEPEDEDKAETPPSSSLSLSLSPQALASIKIRRSCSVPSKAGHNRDSSSSNDSGVSTGSLSHRTDQAEFVEFGFPSGSASSLLKKQRSPPAKGSGPGPGPGPAPAPALAPASFHSSLPRKSKSSDPLRELTFHFHKVKLPAKSSSAEADIPTCLPAKAPKEAFGSPGEVPTVPYVDSRSTSSGTSDMSDYIETLSLSSHSSSDAPDNLRIAGRTVTTTLRPRSGKEYYKIDRSILVEQARTIGTSSNYANVTPFARKETHRHPVT